MNRVLLLNELPHPQYEQSGNRARNTKLHCSLPHGYQLFRRHVRQVLSIAQ